MPDRSVRRTAVTPAIAELVIAAIVFGAYRAGRIVTNDSVEVAMVNADRVVGFQGRIVGLLERDVQDAVMRVPGAIEVLDHFYVFVHFPATTAFLVWVFVRRRQWYADVRNWFVGVTLVALVLHVVYPLAPPRMLDGYVDTLRMYGPQIYSEDPTRSLANQFAAMPSLHFGWALMVAIGIVKVTSGTRRWLWMLYPLVMLLAIVATGNHYVLDAVVAAFLTGVVWLVVSRMTGPPSGVPRQSPVGRMMVSRRSRRVGL